MYSCQYSVLLLNNRAENSHQPTRQRERRKGGKRGGYPSSCQMSMLVCNKLTMPDLSLKD